eukprot:2375255-Prymnesium_polylepis.1
MATSDDFVTEPLSREEMAARAAQAPGVPQMIIERMGRFDGCHRRMIQHHSERIWFWSLMRLLLIGHQDDSSPLRHLSPDVIRFLNFELLRAMLARMSPTT